MQNKIQSANFVLQKINHVLLMKKLFIVMLVQFNSCEKEGCTDVAAENYDSDADSDDGSCSYSAQCIFWTKTNLGKIDIYLEKKYIGTISSYSYSIPYCETPNFVTFEGISGRVYNFMAKSRSGYVCYFSVLLDKEACISIMLYVENSKPKAKQFNVIGTPKYFGEIYPQLEVE